MEIQNVFVIFLEHKAMFQNWWKIRFVLVSWRIDPRSIDPREASLNRFRYPKPPP